MTRGPFDGGAESAALRSARSFAAHGCSGSPLGKLAPMFPNVDGGGSPGSAFGGCASRGPCARRAARCAARSASGSPSHGEGRTSGSETTNSSPAGLRLSAGAGGISMSRSVMESGNGSCSAADP